MASLTIDVEIGGKRLGRDGWGRVLWRLKGSRVWELLVAEAAAFAGVVALSRRLAGGL